MKMGDMVKTKTPGFGTGSLTKYGLVLDAITHGPNSTVVGMIEVMHDDGKILQWYPWQLENLFDEDR